MKIKSLLAFLCLPLAAFAADPVFRVDDFGGVFRDEVNMNADVPDYIRNHPDEAPALAGAFRARVTAAKAALAAAQNAAMIAVAEKEAEKQAAIAAKSAEISALKAKIADLESRLASANK